MMVRVVEDFLQHRLECTWCHSQAMAQEEADAVAALMAAASGDVRSEAEQPPEEEGSPPGMLFTFCGQPFLMLCLTISLAGNRSTFMGNVQAVFQGASFLQDGCCMATMHVAFSVGLIRVHLVRAGMCCAHQQ